MKTLLTLTVESVGECRTSVYNKEEDKYEAQDFKEFMKVRLAYMEPASKVGTYLTLAIPVSLAPRIYYGKELTLVLDSPSDAEEDSAAESGLKGISAKDGSCSNCGIFHPVINHITGERYSKGG